MIEFKYIHTDLNGQLSTEISHKVHSDEGLQDVIQEFRRFLLAVSYHPDSVDQYIEAE